MNQQDASRTSEKTRLAGKTDFILLVLLAVSTLLVAFVFLAKPEVVGL